MDFLIPNLRFLSANPNLNRGQANAGSAAGVGQPAVSKIINRVTKEPSYKTVLGLARHFGVSVDDLLTRDLENDGPSGPSQAAGLDTAKLADLVESVEGAITDSRRDVPSRIKARLIAMLYADNRTSAAGQEAVQALLTSILVSLEEK